MKVYVVEFGEYSGRYVSGVYSSLENAQIATNNSDEITEYELDEALDLWQSGLRYFSVSMSKDGTVREVNNYNYSTQREPSFRAAVPSFATYRLPLGERTLDHIEATLWAVDEEAAIKTTNDARARMIATGEWDEAEQRLNHQPCN